MAFPSFAAAASSKAGLTRLRALALLPRHSIGSRDFGCAAAQLQYDSQEDWEDPMVESEGVVKGRGVQWLVISEAGAKKHIYAERLAKLLVVLHISKGSLVRKELNPLSSLHKQAEDVGDSMEIGDAIAIIKRRRKKLKGKKK